MIHLWANTFHLSCHTFSLPERTNSHSYKPNARFCCCVIVLSLLFYLLSLLLCVNISHPHLNFHLRSECVFDMRDARLFFSGFWLDLNRVDMPHTTSFFITFSRLLLLDLV